MITQIYIILLIGHCYALYISPNNHKILSSLFRNPNLEFNQKQKINKIMYLGYENWAAKRAFEFKRKHYYKCSRISNDELLLYAKCGLYKSILNYKGNSNFTNYSIIYVDSELKRALSDSYSLSILPKNVRLASKKNMNDEEKENYKKLLNVETRSDISHWHYKKKINMDFELDLYDYYDIWNKINNFFDASTRRIIFLKYNYKFEVIRSNRRVAELMCYSEEHIRQRLIFIENQMYRLFKYSNNTN